MEWVHRFATQMFSHPENQSAASQWAHDSRRWYVNSAGKMIKGDSPHGTISWTALEDKSGGTLHDQFGDHILKAPPGAKPGGQVAKWARFQGFSEPPTPDSGKPPGGKDWTALSDWFNQAGYADGPSQYKASGDRVTDYPADPDQG